MNNIDEVRKELIKVFQGLKAGELSGKDVKEMNNCAGKIINTLKAELEYSAQKNCEPNIPFMNYDKEPK